MANRWSTQFFGTLEKKPFQLACNFVVDPTNQNGLGVSSLNGPGIGKVYMHTTASFAGDTHTNFVIDGISSTASLVVGSTISGTGIAAGTTIASITSATAITTSLATTATNAGVTISIVGAGNPNPASGLIMVQLMDNYNKYLFGTGEFRAPLSGSDINISDGASLTVGNVYVITAVGTSTAANWQAMGLPVGITPAVGVSFIASATGSGTGTGKVQTSLTAGISQIEVIGSPNTTITSAAATVLGYSSGAYLVLQTLAPAFTGSALATHTHNFIVKGGQAASTTNNIANYAGPLIGKQEATDATYLGSASATNGGVVAVTAGTPAGTIALSRVAPTALSTIALSFFLSNSVIAIQGQ